MKGKRGRKNEDKWEKEQQLSLKPFLGNYQLSLVNKKVANCLTQHRSQLSTYKHLNPRCNFQSDQAIHQLLCDHGTGGRFNTQFQVLV